MHLRRQATGQLRAHHIRHAADADVLRVHAADRIVEQWVAQVIGIVHAQHAGVMAVLLRFAACRFTGLQRAADVVVQIDGTARDAPCRAGDAATQ